MEDLYCVAIKYGYDIVNEEEEYNIIKGKQNAMNRFEYIKNNHDIFKCARVGKALMLYNGLFVLDEDSVFADTMLTISDALQKIVDKINNFHGDCFCRSGSKMSVGELHNECFDIADSVRNERDRENLIDLVNAVFDGY